MQYVIVVLLGVAIWILYAYFGVIVIFLKIAAIGAALVWAAYLLWAFANPEKSRQFMRENAIRREALRAKRQNEFLFKLQPHISILARNRNKMLLPDEYGIVRRDKWRKELRYFYDHVGVRLYPVSSFLKTEGMVAGIHARQIKRIDDAIAAECDRLRAEFVAVPDSGSEYEDYCANLLRQEGWQVLKTKASGDQGVDLLAERDTIKIAIQCKRYSNAVGNKAVQEVAAGRSLYGATFAAVVSNATFTKSARELASITRVSLLHHTELENLAIMIQNVSPVHASSVG